MYGSWRRVLFWYFQVLLIKLSCSVCTVQSPLSVASWLEQDSFYKDNLYDHIPMCVRSHARPYIVDNHPALICFWKRRGTICRHSAIQFSHSVQRMTISRQDHTVYQGSTETINELWHLGWHALVQRSILSWTIRLDRSSMKPHRIQIGLEESSTVFGHLGQRQSWPLPSLLKVRCFSVIPEHFQNSGGLRDAWSTNVWNTQKYW